MLIEWRTFGGSGECQAPEGSNISVRFTPLVAQGDSGKVVFENDADSIHEDRNGSNFCRNDNV